MITITANIKAKNEEAAALIEETIKRIFVDTLPQKIGGCYIYGITPYKIHIEIASTKGNDSGNYY